MVHQLKHIDSHLGRDNSEQASVVIIWFIQAVNYSPSLTCMTQGIPKRPAAPQTARTNSSFRLKRFISFWSNSSIRLVTITSTIANCQNKEYESLLLKTIVLLQTYYIPYLTVQPQAKQHEEKQHGPELRQWHLSKGLWVNNKNQARP